MSELLNLNLDANQKLQRAVSAFQAFETELEKWVDKLADLPEIKTPETREKVHGLLSDASRVVRKHEELRKATTQPLVELQRTIIDYQRTKADPLQKQIDAGIEALNEFDQRIERLRKEALEELEREKQAKEKERLAEQARVAEIHRKMQAMTAAMKARCASTQIPVIEKAIRELRTWFDIQKFDEFLGEATALKETLLTMAEDRIAELKKQEELAEATRKAKAEKDAIKLQELEAERQRNEAARLEAERQRAIEQEELRKKAEAEKAEKERQLREEAERQAAMDAQVKRELEEARARGISSGIDTIKVIDLALVPEDLYEIKWNINALKKALKEGDVPGVEITFKNKLILNGRS